MRFMKVAKAKGEYTAEERLARRMEFLYPEGVKVLAEYWSPMNEFAVVTIFEADSLEPIFNTFRVWDKYFEFTIVPVCTAEEGLEMAKKQMQVAIA